MPVVESIAANFSNISIKNKENIKIGWGTDSTQYTFGNDPEITNSGNEILLTRKDYTFTVY